MSVFLSIGTAFKISCFLCGWWPFIHSVVAENNFLCRYFCRLGPALEFLVRLGPFIHLVVAENNYSTCRVLLSCVSLNWTIYFLVVFVSVVSCRSYLTSSI